MYHIELRQFPHNFCHFNVGERELAQLLGNWVQGRPVELGERKWSPHQARLKVLEGPELAVEELSLGRGWPTARRRSVDVTERVVAAATEQLHAAAGPTSLATQMPAGAAGAPSPRMAAAGPAGAGPVGDPLAVGVQIAALLGPDATRLLEAWRAAAAASPGSAPSETLAQAERKLATEQPG